MTKPGPKPKPALTVVREGNPGKRPVKVGAVVGPGGLIEPDWTDFFPVVRVPAAPRKPGRDADEDAVSAWKLATRRRAYAVERKAENDRLRAIARGEWDRIVPTLVKSVGLAEVDQTVVQDYCLCVARIDQCERGLSRDGLLQLGERGWMKNGLTTIVGQYRTQLKTYIGELGLSPSSRTSIEPGGGDDDDDDPFD